MNKIAIVPARSGSKGLKNKNILELCGKPIMNYSIEAAIEANCFEHIYVSTDSKQYGLIANSAGGEVVYRDILASSDTASTFMVIQDLFEKIDMNFDYFVLLQPTSPLRNSRHIIDAINLFESRYDEFDFLVSVKEAESSKVLVNPIGDDGSLKHFDTDFANYRRQMYCDYTPNGAIFIAKPQAYLSQKHFFGAKSLAFIMSEFDSVDIDNDLDYKLATLCMAERMRGIV